MKQMEPGPSGLLALEDDRLPVRTPHWTQIDRNAIGQRGWRFRLRKCGHSRPFYCVGAEISYAEHSSRGESIRPPNPGLLINPSCRVSGLNATERANAGVEETASNVVSP